MTEINQLFETEGHSIFHFKKGDIIIRVKPAVLRTNKYNENLGIEAEVSAGIDNSYREPMEFIAIENNLIYLRYLGGVFKSKISKAALEIYSEGWELFKVPEGLSLDDCI